MQFLKLLLVLELLHSETSCLSEARLSRRRKRKMTTKKKGKGKRRAEKTTWKKAEQGGVPQEDGHVEYEDIQFHRGNEDDDGEDDSGSILTPFTFTDALTENNCRSDNNDDEDDKVDNDDTLTLPAVRTLEGAQVKHFRGERISFVRKLSPFSFSRCFKME